MSPPTQPRRIPGLEERGRAGHRGCVLSPPAAGKPDSHPEPAPNPILPSRARQAGLGRQSQGLTCCKHPGRQAVGSAETAFPGAQTLPPHAPLAGTPALTSLSQGPKCLTPCGGEHPAGLQPHSWAQETGHHRVSVVALRDGEAAAVQWESKAGRLHIGPHWAEPTPGSWGCSRPAGGLRYLEPGLGVGGMNTGFPGHGVTTPGPWSTGSWQPCL